MKSSWVIIHAKMKLVSNILETLSVLLGVNKITQPFAVFIHITAPTARCPVRVKSTNRAMDGV
jgi:hypothetical protein